MKTPPNSSLDECKVTQYFFDALKSSKIDSDFEDHVLRFAPSDDLRIDSIKFWFEEDWWKLDNKTIKERCKRIRKQLVLSYASYYSGKGDFIKIYTLIRWLETKYHKSHYQRPELHSLLECIPVPEPEINEDLLDQDLATILVTSLKRKIWIDKKSNNYEPTEKQYELVYDRLKQLTDDYLSKKITIPKEHKHNFVRNISYCNSCLKDDFGLLPKIHTNLIALMRSRIKFEYDLFDIYDYAHAIRNCCQNEDVAWLILKQLLITLQNCSKPCSDEKLGFEPGLSEDNHFIPEPFKGFSPERCVACLIHIVISKINLANWDHKLCEKLAEYCLSRIKSKKGSKGRFDGSSGYYSDSLCMEENPIWRRAYVKVLGGIGYDLNGKVNKTLSFVRDHDPDKEVRNDADESYEKIRRKKTIGLDKKKSLILSFYFLRWAQRESLGQPINKGLAEEETRSKELRLSSSYQIYQYSNYYKF